MNIRCNGCFEEYDVKFQICPHCGYTADGPATEVYCLLPGTVLMDRYIVGSVVGLGGFGIIYKAWDKKLDTVIAIKEFFPTRLIKRNADGRTVSLLSESRREEFEHCLDRFLMEARNLARFNKHPNIVNLFEFFELNGTAYIVMEYLDGVNLDQYIQHVSSDLDCETAMEIALCVCSAIKDIHAEKIVHRDISPENIIICRNGTVKVIDLGAAYFGQEDMTPDDIVIKPGYAPPEQYNMVSAQGPEMDIYAIGAVMYFMLTGLRPTESTDRKENDTLEAPSGVKSAVPEFLDGIVMKSMAVDRRFRYRSVDHLVDALQNGKSPRTMEQEIRIKEIIGYVSIMAVCVFVAVFALLVLLRAERGMIYPAQTITVWCVSDGDVSAAGIQDAVNDFCNEHPEVVVEMEFISGSEYADRFALALSSGDVPDIYDSVQLGDLFAGQGTENIFAQIALEPEDLLFAEDYDSCYPKGDSIPTGFAVPVVYVNTALVEELPAEISSADDLVSLISSTADGAQYCAYDTSAEEILAGTFGEEWENFRNTYITADYGSFSAGLCPVYLSDTSRYNVLLSQMPGMFRVVKISTDRVFGRFTGAWSISSLASEDEQTCAIGLISYMCSDSGQDSMHIRNAGGSLPVSRQAYSEYRDVYIELSSVLNENAEYAFLCGK